MPNLLPDSHPLAGHDSLIDQLCECGRFFHARGWSVGTSSNYSVALSSDPVELIVTASGKDKGRLAANDFVHVGSDGQPIEDAQPKSSAETMLHVVLAEQNEVGCILHTHSVWGTLLSEFFFDNGGFEIEGYEMLKGLEGIKLTITATGFRFSKTHRTFRFWPIKFASDWLIRWSP